MKSIIRSWRAPSVSAHLTWYAMRSTLCEELDTELKDDFMHDFSSIKRASREASIINIFILTTGHMTTCM